ncbi:MAG: hypothetical protein WBC04_00955 [Candidatus Acidiferrales bacterium]
MPTQTSVRAEQQISALSTNPQHFDPELRGITQQAAWRIIRATQAGAVSTRT